MKSKGKRFSYGVIALLAVVFLAASFSATAQAAGNGPYGQLPSRQQFRKMKQKINTLRIWRLTKVLNLDENAASRVFPVLNSYEKKRTNIQYRQMVLMRNLRIALSNRNDSRIQNILGRLEANHQRMQSLNNAEGTDLQKVLTVEQQAKFLLFQVRFNHQVRKMISEARQKRISSGNGRGE